MIPSRIPARFASLSAPALPVPAPIAPESCPVPVSCVMCLCPVSCACPLWHPCIPVVVPPNDEVAPTCAAIPTMVHSSTATQQTVMPHPPVLPFPPGDPTGVVPATASVLAIVTSARVDARRPRATDVARVALDAASNVAGLGSPTVQAYRGTASPGACQCGNAQTALRSRLGLANCAGTQRHGLT